MKSIALGVILGVLTAPLIGYIYLTLHDGHSIVHI